MQTLAVGQRVVLEPEGLLGSVAGLHHDDGAARFSFESLQHQTVVDVESDRWRPPMSDVEARAAMRDIAAALPLAELAAFTGRPDTATPLVDALRAHLEGTRDQRITGYATLIDACDVAARVGGDDGPFRGLLADGRLFLLGELALSLGATDTELARRLFDLRAAHPVTDRVRLGAPAPRPPAPSHHVDDPGWLPGPPGAYGLGRFEVRGAVTIAAEGWAMPGPETDAANVNGALSVRAEPGTWHAALFVQPETLPADIDRVPMTRFSRTVLLALMRRSWLVVAHARTPLAVPEVLPDGDTASWVARVLALDETGQDPLASARVGVGAGRTALPLTIAGDVDAVQGRVAVVGSARWTRSLTSALRATEHLRAAAWEWGATYRCGRSPALPVFVGGEPGRCTIIALPSTF